MAAWAPTRIRRTSRRTSRSSSCAETFPLFEGFRGAPKADVAALEDVILRVSALRVSARVEAHPSVVEMDCNPVMVLPRGAPIVDARIRVQEAPPAKPLAARAAR